MDKGKQNLSLVWGNEPEALHTGLTDRDTAIDRTSPAPTRDREPQQASATKEMLLVYKTANKRNSLSTNGLTRKFYYALQNSYQFYPRTFRRLKEDIPCCTK